jgi:hypothetical protein
MISVANKQITVQQTKTLTGILYSKKADASVLPNATEKWFYSITCDHRTSLAQEIYGAFALHIINNFQLKTFVMSGTKHENGSKAEEVDDQLLFDMNIWRHESRNFIDCVADTAANANSFGIIDSAWEDALFLQHSYFAEHMCCMLGIFRIPFHMLMMSMKINWYLLKWLQN